MYPSIAHFPQIAFHVPGGDELHFLLNQRPFFLGYSEFDLHRPFPAAHAALLSPCKEGLGHFPTSNFQPPRRRAQGGENTERVPLSYACYSSFRILPTMKAQICRTLPQKKKNAIETMRSHSVLLPVLLCAYSFSTSVISLAVAVTIRMPLSLIPSSSASSCRRLVDFSASLFGKKN